MNNLKFLFDSGEVTIFSGAYFPSFKYVLKFKLLLNYTSRIRRQFSETLVKNSDESFYHDKKNEKEKFEKWKLFQASMKCADSYLKVLPVYNAWSNRL